MLGKISQLQLSQESLNEGVTFSSSLTYIAILKDSNWIVFRREIHAHSRSAFVKDFDWIPWNTVDFLL